MPETAIHVDIPETPPAGYPDVSATETVSEAETPTSGYPRVSTTETTIEPETPTSIRESCIADEWPEEAVHAVVGNESSCTEFEHRNADCGDITHRTIPGEPPVVDGACYTNNSRNSRTQWTLLGVEDTNATPRSVQCNTPPITTCDVNVDIYDVFSTPREGANTRSATEGLSVGVDFSSATRKDHIVLINPPGSRLTSHHLPNSSNDPVSRISENTSLVAAHDDLGPSESFDMTFGHDGTQTTVVFTRRPLGLKWKMRSPIKIKDVARGSHAEELGIQKKWEITAVAGVDVRRMRYHDITERIQICLEAFPWNDESLDWPSGFTSCFSQTARA